MGGWRYGSVLFTMVLDEGVLSVVCPGCFTPGEKTPNSGRTAGWVGPRFSVGMVPKKNIPPHSGNWTLVIQHIAY